MPLLTNVSGLALNVRIQTQIMFKLLLMFMTELRVGLGCFLIVCFLLLADLLLKVGLRRNCTLLSIRKWSIITTMKALSQAA